MIITVGHSDSENCLLQHAISSCLLFWAIATLVIEEFPSCIHQVHRVQLCLCTVATYHEVDLVRGGGGFMGIGKSPDYVQTTCNVWDRLLDLLHTSYCTELLSTE